jgi:hypothetical protein
MWPRFTPGSKFHVMIYQTVDRDTEQAAISSEEKGGRSFLKNYVKYSRIHL